jgi:hypothetical protein
VRIHPLFAVALFLYACNAEPGSPAVEIRPEAPTTSDLIEVVVTGEAIDPDGDEVQYTYQWSLDGQEVANLTGNTVTADRTERGQVWSVVVTAFDGAKPGVPASAEVEVVNALPTVTLELPANAATDSNLRPVEVTTDPDGDPVTLTWAWTVNGRDAAIAAQDVPAARTTRGEVWVATAVPNDGLADGTPATATTSIDNTAPAVAAVTLSPNPPGEADTLTAGVTAFDADDDEITLAYTWEVDGIELDVGGPTLTGANFDKGQNIRVTVTPNDGSVDGEPRRSEAVTAKNTPPSLGSATVRPSAVTKGVTPSCDPAGWNDVDGDTPGYQTQWFVNGTVAATSTTLPDTAFVRGDRITCTVTPFDGEALGTPVNSTAVVVGNALPSLSGATLSATAPREKDTLTVTPLGAADLDGDKVGTSVQWEVNGRVVTTGPSLTGASFKKGDSIVAIVTPNDGLADGTPVRSPAATVANTPPVVTSVTLSPNPVTTEKTLTASVVTADDDGDTVSPRFAWTVDGTAVSPTTATLDGTLWFDRDDRVVVSVTPFDGTDSGTASTASITVANTAPTRATVAIDPASPVPDDDLWCEVTVAATDLDKDPISYTFAWTREGSAYTGAIKTEYAGDTVPKSATSAGETWVCTATPSDGTATGPASTSTVKIAGLGETKDTAVKDCKTLKALDSSRKSGVTWIDPDGDTDKSDAFQVWCDQTTAGGGWTVTWYVDANHFDGWYGNDRNTNTAPPTSINAQKDIWNAESVMSFTESMVACTTQNDAATHYWQYGSKNLHTYFSDTSTTWDYRTDASSASSTTAGRCVAAHKGGSGTSYGFMVVESSGSCGSCNTMLWGMYHYTGGGGCNSTSTTYGSHTSPWRSATVEYPICAGSQTSNGKFWIGVR